MIEQKVRKMQKCPFFDMCGGCAYDFTTPAYRAQKSLCLPKTKFTDKPIWGQPGTRRRAEFAFVDRAAFRAFPFDVAQRRDLFCLFDQCRLGGGSAGHLEKDVPVLCHGEEMRRGEGGKQCRPVGTCL